MVGYCSSCAFCHPVFERDGNFNARTDAFKEKHHLNIKVQLFKSESS